MEQIEKNTVSAQNQLKKTEYVFFEDRENKGPRILFVGNSMTCHGIKHEIGWHNQWGMAASAKEKDYVHLCISHIKNRHPNATFCVCQVSAWEMIYQNAAHIYPLYEAARNFQADVIIWRAVENCPTEGFEKDIFISALDGLLGYLNPDGHAKILLTTGFWRHIADEGIRAYGQAHNLSLCELGDLGELDEMKALGLFEHEGVANHPGDLGMQKIAERICKALEANKAF